MFDPFGDFETAGYLRNFRGLKDRKLISSQERLACQAFAPKAARYVRERKHISYSDVLHVHEILFGKIYPWAGTDRSVTAPHLSISKAGIEGIFALPGQEKLAMDHALRMAEDASVMRAKPGEVMGYMAYSHPFLDGNGRTIMLVHQELCHRAGFHINWQGTSKSQYLHVLTEELASPGKGFLDDYLRCKIAMKPLDLVASVDSFLTLPGLNAAARDTGSLPAPEQVGGKQDDALNRLKP